MKTQRIDHCSKLNNSILPLEDRKRRKAWWYLQVVFRFLLFAHHILNSKQ